MKCKICGEWNCITLWRVGCVMEMGRVRACPSCGALFMERALWQPIHAHPKGEDQAKTAAEIK